MEMKCFKFQFNLAKNSFLFFDTSKNTLKVNKEGLSNYVVSHNGMEHIYTHVHSLKRYEVTPSHQSETTYSHGKDSNLLTFKEFS